MAILCPNTRKTVTPAAKLKFGAKGKAAVAKRAGRLPRAITGFRPILSESLPAKILQVRPTKPEADRMKPICSDVAEKCPCNKAHL